MSRATLAAPFPWFGGKSRIAGEVWARLGECRSYVEPFFGSGAMLLGRPGGGSGVETINDADGMVANFWRALQADPDAVAHYADWPVNECDLHARHLWLVGQRERLTERLMGDHAFYDARAAGWWVWGASAWIGSGWCSGRGPWISVDGVLTDARKMPHLGDAGRGINRQMPHLGDAGRGINRQMPHLSNAGRGINRQMPHLSNAGQGINRQMPHLSNAGQGIRETMRALADRMRRVRVVCGDWSRVMGPSVLWPTGGVCGVFLDPPYRSDNTIEYAHGLSVCHDEIEAWCRDNGSRDDLRVALCGYEGEYDLPGWDVIPWKAHGGYGSQGDKDGRTNSRRERVWFSPACQATASMGALL